MKPSTTRPPRKRVHVDPAYPAWPAGTAGSGLWMGEAVVRADGTVARVWTIRAPAPTPPFPALTAAIVESIERWEYEPYVHEGATRAFCTTITVLINWQ